MPNFDLSEHDHLRREGIIQPLPLPADRRGVFISVGETANAISDWPDRVTVNIGGELRTFGPFEEPVIG